MKLCSDFPSFYLLYDIIANEIAIKISDFCSFVSCSYSATLNPFLFIHHSQSSIPYGTHFLATLVLSLNLFQHFIFVQLFNALKNVSYTFLVLSIFPRLDALPFPTTPSIDGTSAA